MSKMSAFCPSPAEVAKETAQGSTILSVPSEAMKLMDQKKMKEMDEEHKKTNILFKSSEEISQMKETSLKAFELCATTAIVHFCILKVIMIHRYPSRGDICRINISFLGGINTGVFSLCLQVLPSRIGFAAASSRSNRRICSAGEYGNLHPLPPYSIKILLLRV
jgi:hypothetical protein